MEFQLQTTRFQTQCKTPPQEPGARKGKCTKKRKGVENVKDFSPAKSEIVLDFQFCRIFPLYPQVAGLFSPPARSILYWGDIPNKQTHAHTKPISLILKRLVKPRKHFWMSLQEAVKKNDASQGSKTSLKSSFGHHSARLLVVASTVPLLS